MMLVYHWSVSCDYTPDFVSKKVADGCTQVLVLYEEKKKKRNVADGCAQALVLYEGKQKKKTKVYLRNKDVEKNPDSTELVHFAPHGIQDWRLHWGGGFCVVSALQRVLALLYLFHRTWDCWRVSWLKTVVSL